MNMFYQADIKEAIRIVLQDWLDNEHGTTATQEHIDEYYQKLSKWKEGQKIPLTPEWLERCGFEKFEDEYADIKVWSKSLIEIALKDGKFYLHASCTDPWYNQCIGEPIEYLHQLQNLFFALTGGELQIKTV